MSKHVITISKMTKSVAIMIMIIIQKSFEKVYTTNFCSDELKNRKVNRSNDYDNKRVYY